MRPAIILAPGKATTLMVALIVLLTALVLPTVPASAAPDETFADDFQSGDFGGSTGSLPWVGPWIETGESDGVGAGTIRVDDEPQCMAEPCLLLGRDPGPDASVEREVDLSSFESATLTFDYNVHWHPPGGGSAELRVSDDGGGNWFALDSWPLGTSTGDLVGSYDLTPYRAPNTRIMFAVTGNSNDSHMNVDNLVVTGSDIPVFYAVAGSGGGGGGDDLLTAVRSTDSDPATNEVNIGIGTGSSGIQAAAWQPSTGVPYAIDGGQLGTIDLATGTLVAKPSPVGTGSGSQGAVLMDDVVGLAFDPATGDLYGAQRRSSTEALLFLIDPTTGAIRTGVFGGDDYIEIQPDGLNFQVTDLAFDPTTAELYVIQVSEILRTFTLSTLDPSTGSTNSLGSVPDDLRGLDFDAAGRLWATTATGSTPEQLHELDKTSGAILSSIDLDNGADYEALAIPRSAPVNQPPMFEQDLLDRSDSEGTLIDIDSPATDPDVGNTLTYSAVGLPEGTSIDPASGTITGALSPNTEGVYAVTITVSDNGTPSMQDTDGFTWTVSAGENLYLVAGSGGGAGGNDLLTAVDHSDFDPVTNETSIGAGTGTNNIYAATIDPGSGVLYAANNAQMGIIDPTSGIFSSLPSTFGSGNGSIGFVTFFDVTGLVFDPGSGFLYACHDAGAGSTLFRVDPATGAAIPGAFGGNDYVLIQPQQSGQYLNATDLAFDPVAGVLYTVLTNHSNKWRLVSIDPVTGATIAIGDTVDWIRGLAFDRSGQLWGTTAGAGSESLYEISLSDGAATNQRSIDNGANYEAIAFALEPTPNRPPVFDQDLTDRGDAEGGLAWIPATATDPDIGDTLTYTAVGLPEGISIDSNTGIISGALGPSSAGVHNVTLTVTDDGSPGLQDTDVFAWTVSPGEVTYLIANTGGGDGGDDLLTAVDRADPDPATNEANIGTGTGTTNIEAAALQPGTNVLFAVENDQLGTVDVTTGVFTPRPQIAGVGNGSAGLIAFDNIQGLSFQRHTGELFATHTRSTSTPDLLLRLDPATGAHVPGVFAGDDYIVIQSQGLYHHSADIAFDPTDDQLFMIHYTVLGWRSLASVDPATGSTSSLGTAPGDTAGLAFDGIGRLFASTDGAGTELLHELNKADATSIDSITIDNASNYEALAIATAADPNQAPVFNQDLLDRTDPEGSIISLSAAATDPDTGDNLSYVATGLPSGLSIASGSGLITGAIDFAAAGDYPVEVLVLDDGIPNLGDADTFTWTVTEVNRPPVFEQDLPDRTDPEGAVISLSASATDPDGGDFVTYGASGLPSGLAIDPFSGMISGTIDYTAATGSPYAVTITASDDRLPPETAVPDTFSWTVANTNRAPVMVSPGPQTTPELALFSILVSATDADGMTPSITDSGTLPAWAVLTDNLDGTATIAGTPGAGDSGTTTVTVTASDGSLTDDAAFDLTVSNTNLPPAIANPGNQAGAEGTPFSLLITASDPDGTTVGFSDGGTLPAWATLIDNGDDAATITGTPGYTDAGTTTVTITASDGSLTDDAVFDISIANTNRAPVVDPIGDHTCAEGTALTPIVVTASDPDGTTPSLTDLGLPSWASFVDNGDGTGTITGTPGYADAGSGIVGITAFDGGLPDTETFTLTVTNTNQPPTINPIADQSVAEGAALVPVAITASDPDGTTPELAATGLPGWATFIDNGDGTATITGTPGYDDAAVTTITINAEDGGVPNLSDDTTFDLTVTNTNRAPVADPITDQSVAEATPFTLVVSASDPDGSIPALTEAGLPGWASLVDNGDGTGTISGTPGYTDAGTSTVTITASDGTLSDDSIFDLTVTNSNQAPVADPISDQTVAENNPFALTVTGSDPDGTTPTLSAAGLPAWATFADNGDGTGTINGTPGYTDAGTSTVTLTASDGTLSDDSAFDLTVTEVNRPPVFGASLGDRTDAEGAAVSYAAGATDPDLNTLSYGATGLPPGVSISPTTGLLTGTLSFTAAGTHTVVVTARDDGTPNLAATDTFTWTVTDTNQTPVVDPIANQTIAENDPFTLTITASDPDGTTPALTVAGLPSWASMIDNGDGTATIAGTPGYTDAATTAVTITASDGTLTDDATFDLTVTNTNRLPVFDTNLDDRTDAEDDAISLTAGAADPDGDNLVFAASGLPPGLAIDPATGVISGTVSSAAAGSHDVELTVTDDGDPNLSAVDTFTWTIANTNRRPFFDATLEDRTDAEGATVSVDAGASDPDLDELTYSATGLPPGLTIDTKTGQVGGAVGYAAATGSPYSVAITVSDGGDPELTAVDTFTWTITNTNRALALTAPDGKLGAEGNLIAFTATATDPDGDGLTFSMGGAPLGATMDAGTGVFGWVPSEAQGPGSYAITVQVTDDGVPAQATSKIVTITVTETNQAPTIAAIEGQGNREGDPIELVAIATDSDLPLNTLKYAATGLPPGLTIDVNTGVVTGTIRPATAVDSPYTVSVTVTDDGTPAMSAATTFAWVVTAPVALPPEAPNEPPHITPTPNQLNDEDDTVDLTIAATDTGTITYSATGLPPGLTIDPATGRISGIVDSTASSESPYTTTITATDDGTPSLSSTDTFTWTITNRPAAQRKQEVVNALEGFEETPTEAEDTQTIRRSLVLMGSTAAATAASLRWPLTLLLAILIGVAFVGRIGLYPLLWRGNRQGGTISFYDSEVGFGLIAPDDDKGEIFVHENAFRLRQRQTLAIGTRVKYRLLASENRPSAWGATIEADNG